MVCSPAPCPPFCWVVSLLMCARSASSPLAMFRASAGCAAVFPGRLGNLCCAWRPGSSGGASGASGPDPRHLSLASRTSALAPAPPCPRPAVPSRSTSVVPQVFPSRALPWPRLIARFPPPPLLLLGFYYPPCRVTERGWRCPKLRTV